MKKFIKKNSGLFSKEYMFLDFADTPVLSKAIAETKNELPIKSISKIDFKPEILGPFSVYKMRVSNKYSALAEICLYGVFSECMLENDYTTKMALFLGANGVTE